jgi:hypothetical protein
VKDRAAAGGINHVIDLLLCERSIFAKQLPGDSLPLHASAVGDVAKMRFDPGFSPEVSGFDDCH